MVVVPAVTPVTTPVEELIVATAGLLDVQTPLAVVLDNVVVDPVHTAVDEHPSAFVTVTV
jgi:hypothetical protein